MIPWIDHRPLDVMDASIFVKWYLSAGSVTTYLEAAAVFGLVTPSLVSPSEHEGLQVSFALWRRHAFDSAKGEGGSPV